MKTRKKIKPLLLFIYISVIGGILSMIYTLPVYFGADYIYKNLNYKSAGYEVNKVLVIGMMILLFIVAVYKAIDHAVRLLLKRYKLKDGNYFNVLLLIFMLLIIIAVVRLFLIEPLKTYDLSKSFGGLLIYTASALIIFKKHNKDF